MPPECSQNLCFTLEYAKLLYVMMAIAKLAFIKLWKQNFLYLCVGIRRCCSCVGILKKMSSRIIISIFLLWTIYCVGKGFLSYISRLKLFCEIVAKFQLMEKDYGHQKVSSIQIWPVLSTNFYHQLLYSWAVVADLSSCSLTVPWAKILPTDHLSNCSQTWQLTVGKGI